MKEKTLYLVDGNSLVYRAFYALNLSTKEGIPTGAVYGFFTTMRKLLKQYTPQYIAICFDVSRKTHRQEKFKEYKIKRPPAPDALKTQIPIVKELIGAMGLAILEKEGYEADDIISSLTHDAHRHKWNVVIITQDKDMYQLIRENKVCVYNPVKDKLYNEKLFVEEFGFLPKHIVDYLALTGDSVDNIPGAKGIGKVGASRLIKQFKTVEGIFHNIDEVNEKLKTVLMKNKKNIALSKELILLEEYPGLTFNPGVLAIKNPDDAKIYEICHNLEFKSFLKSLSKPSAALENKLVDGFDETIVRAIKKQKLLCFYYRDGCVYAYDAAMSSTYKVSFKEARPLIDDVSVTKITYDYKTLLLSCGEDVTRGVWFDVMIAAYVADPTLGDYSFGNLCTQFLSVSVDEESPGFYPSLIAQLYRIFAGEIKDKKLEKLFFTVEMPLVAILADMQKHGVSIDRRALAALCEKVALKVKESSSSIYKLSKQEFNLNSPKQLQKVLFDDLKIPPVKRTKTGYSTDEEVLVKLSSQHVIAKHLLEYRSHSKLKSTYLDPFVKEVSKGDGRIHAQFVQTATQTGRLSSRSPNLQNIPIKGDFARAFRKVFVPSFKKGVILSADYSQIELRILAHFTQDHNLLGAFNQKADIHAYTASLLFDVEQDEVEKKEREIAKRVNFGIVYGMSSFGLARELGISNDAAYAFIDNYFTRYPKVKEFMEVTTAQAKKKGYVTTLLGRIRQLPGINSKNIEVREFSRRQAINTPIQGTAADLIKLAMIKVHEALNAKKLSSKMILQVHDELVFDARGDEIGALAMIVKEQMENCLTLDVPIVVNLKYGKNWLELTPL